MIEAWREETPLELDAKIWDEVRVDELLTEQAE